MTKSNSGIAIMDKKILQKAVILSAFFLTGCSCFQDWGADQTYVDTAYETETVTVETKKSGRRPDTGCSGYRTAFCFAIACRQQ